jgi:hypothetical protein
MMMMMIIIIIIIPNKIKIYETIIIPAVCRGVKLGLSRRLRAFENRVLRVMFGPERAEMIGGWRKFHNAKSENEMHKVLNTVMLNNNNSYLRLFTAKLKETLANCRVN